MSLEVGEVTKPNHAQTVYHPAQNRTTPKSEIAQKVNTLNPTYPLNPNWSLKDQNVLLVIFELSNLVYSFGNHFLLRNNYSQC